MASNAEIVMYWHHGHGWAGEIRNIGLFGTLGFSKWKLYCHMGSQYIWKKGQQSRIMAVIFVDLHGFLISVRTKLHEPFTVYTLVAFTRWPRVAVKSTFSVISHDSKRGIRVTVACGNRARSNIKSCWFNDAKTLRRLHSPSLVNVRAMRWDCEIA